MNRETQTLILGAGPTGLGAALRLHQLGVQDFLVIDELSGPGGLAGTDITPEGFLFDLGGHVIFSHYQYFTQVLDALPMEWNTLPRVSYVKLKNRWVPYPFQQNLFCLDTDDQLSCVNGLIDSMTEWAHKNPANFDEWILKVLGVGIADLFMRPYNFKVWATLPKDMQCEWLGERVATADLKKVVANILKNREEVGWGPNATFRYPLRGGTGQIWREVGQLIPAQNQAYGLRVVKVDAHHKIVHCENGTQIKYSQLISTLPADLMASQVVDPPIPISQGYLRHSTTHIVGIGLRGLNPHESKCWLYFPEDDCPFYRVTVFSLYSEFNCPDAQKELPTLLTLEGGKIREAHPKTARPGPYWSLMLEVSESDVKPVDASKLLEDCVCGLVNTGLIQETDEVVSVYERKVPYGYPVPSLDRNQGIQEVQAALEPLEIYSRGRFGGWKYEVANQDHSFMQGVELVDRLKSGSSEKTWETPNVANGQFNTDLSYP